MEMKKNSRLVAIVMLMMVVAPAYSAAIDDWGLPDAPKTEAQIYFDQIPVEKRELFIRYYLGKALEEQGTYVVRSPWMEGKDAEEDFGAPPEGFTTSLLNWTQNEFELDDGDVARLAYGSKLCFPGKGCYPDEIGNHCCPF